MPYTRRHDRKRDKLETVGDLNFQIHQLIDDFLPERPGYTDYNGVLGVLSAVQMEMYRRAVVPYEDGKIKENGDCQPYMRLLKKEDLPF